MDILASIFTKAYLNEIINGLIENDNIISLVGEILGIFVILYGAIMTCKKIIIYIITWIMKRKLKKNWYKELEFPISKKTKESFHCYIPTRGQDIDPCDSEEMVDNRPCFSQELIPFFMQDNFDKNKSRYYIVLADSGMGKTTFLFNLFFSYYKKLLRKHEIKFIPLSINDVFEEIGKIENQQNTILLLDGLDENREAMNDHKEYLEMIVEKTIKFHTIIITCRTQFFSNETDEPKNVDVFSVSTNEKKVMFEKVYISPFNQLEIDTYLKKRYSRIFERNKIKCAKKLIANCPKLMVRPMLLAYIDDLITDRTNTYNHAYEIYSELVSKWIERETNDQDNRKRLYQFSEKLAEHMYSEGSVFISENEIEKLCAKYNIKINTIEAKSRSLLNRNINGNYKFAHKSILEYFLAIKAFNELEFRKSIMTNGYQGYDMLRLFLKEMGTVQLNKIFQERVKKVSFAFLPLEKVFFSFCNYKYFDFEGSDLSNVVFSSADLTGANLKYANLKRANLREADLREADLEGADLRRADLRRANLEGTDLRRADLSEAWFQFSKLMYANLSKAMLKNANLIGADLRRANLKDVDLTDAELDRSEWYASDVKKIFQQLKSTKFTYIVVVDCKKKELYKNELFSDINSSSGSSLFLNSELRKNIEDAGIELLDFVMMDYDEKIKALEAVGLDPFDYSCYQ